MKKTFFADVGIAFIFIFSACLVNLAVMSLAVRIVNLFIVVDYFMAAIIRLAVSVIVISGMVAAEVYFISYRKAHFNMESASLSFWIATVLQLVFCLLLKFHPFIGGGTLYLAGFFEHGSGFDGVDTVEYIGIIDYLLAFIILAVVNYLVYIICGKIGAAKRLRDRADTLAGK